MTFAAYGLVIHDGSVESRRAGRVYLVLAILGEALVLSGVLALVGSTGAMTFEALAPALAELPERAAIGALLALGFGVKMGLLPLHVWLPLAHRCAPAAASALLSGVLVKLGLLGWLRLLPLGESALPTLGTGLVRMGFAGAFYAALIGITQTRAKTVLAYSTVSQLGLLTALTGFALASTQRWPVAAAAIAIFALHHALAKAALFLGAGALVHGLPGRLGPRIRARAGAVLPALVLAGLPGTSGAVAKTLLKETAGPQVGWLEGALTASAFATTVLLARAIWLLERGGERPASPPTGLAVPWLALAAVSVAFGPIALWLPHALGLGEPLPLRHLWTAPWPVLAGVLAATLAARYRPPAISLPEGDLVVLAERAVSALRGAGAAAATGLAASRAAVARRSAPLRGRARPWASRRSAAWYSPSSWCSGWRSRSGSRTLRWPPARQRCSHACWNGTTLLEAVRTHHRMLSSEGRSSPRAERGRVPWGKSGRMRHRRPDRHHVVDVPRGDRGGRDRAA